MPDQRPPFQPTDPFSPVNESPAWTLLQSQRRPMTPRPSVARSVGYAIEGIGFAFRTQRNFRIHCVVGFVAVGLAVGLRLPVHQVVLVVALAALVLCAELMNTAIESTLDLHAGADFDPTVKSIKDIAAASVFVICLGAAVLGASIFLPAFAHAISR